jgi:hypothetical protein
MQKTLIGSTHFSEVLDTGGSVQEIAIAVAKIALTSAVAVIEEYDDANTIMQRTSHADLRSQPRARRDSMDQHVDSGISFLN